MTDYAALCKSLSSLTDGVNHFISNLANACALLYGALKEINWLGFYLLDENEALILAPFQGKIACIEIPKGKGVCGAAVAEGKTIIVDNVHEFAGHIACDSASNSEMVVPLRINGVIKGVLDIDSTSFARFDVSDREGVEDYVNILGEALSKCEFPQKL